MNISLDYDDTYTRDPATWDKVIQTFREAGSKVYIVTWRFDKQTAFDYGGLFGDESGVVREALDGKVDGMFFTGRTAKAMFMYNQGIRIDVWIDDDPQAILRNMQGH
jgi:hypothetical protein